MAKNTTELAVLKHEPTRLKIQQAMHEMGRVLKARENLIPGMWTAIIARQHLLMVAKGGTAKSMAVRELRKHIEGASYVEVALDETSTPDQVSGPPDIKCMVDEGKTRRVTTGMLPEADIAFLDEFFNANKPVLHHIMPMLNERIFHNNGTPSEIPLWSAFMGTNQINSDVALAWVYDRIQHRHQVDYVQDRDVKRSLVSEAVVRRSLNHVEPERTVVTLAELKNAHDEAMTLEVPDAVWDIFLDLMEEVGREGIVVSDRRVVECMAGVLASAWLNGHTVVRVGDLTVLQNMLWTELEQIAKVRAIVLNACNPGEKKALELLDDLSKLNSEYTAAKGLDKVKLNAAAIDIFKKCDRLLNEATPLRKKAAEAGASTDRIDTLVDGCSTLKYSIGSEVFGLGEDALKNLNTR